MQTKFIMSTLESQKYIDSVLPWQFHGKWAVYDPLPLFTGRELQKYGFGVL